MDYRLRASLAIAALILVAGSPIRAQASAGRGAFSEAGPRLIAEAFLSGYDRQETKGGTEFLVKNFGRASYKRLLDHWVKELVAGVASVAPPPLDPAYDGLIAAVRRDAPELESVFVRSATRLVELALANFELYREAAARSGALGSGSLDQLKLEAELSQVGYAARFDAFIAEERAVKARLQSILDDPRLKPKLGFYRFVYDRVNDIRERSIARQEALRAARVELARGDS